MVAAIGQTGFAQHTSRPDPHCGLARASNVSLVVSESADIRRALALGLGGGLRSFAPPVASVIHHRGPVSVPVRFIILGAAATELVVDKLPSTPSRWSRRGMLPRLAFSAAGGGVLARGPGAGIAAAAAVGSAFVGSKVRARVVGRNRRLIVAVCEDALSYSLVLAATSSPETSATHR